MQSRLPDVNTAFIKHRNGAIEGIASQNWDKVFGSLYSWNSLLPRYKDDDGNLKYRVVVSDIEYQKLTQVKSEAQCIHCETWVDYNKIKVFDMIVPMIEGIITNTKSTKVWICQKCKKDCKITETIIAETKLKEPYFLGVVPTPPRRKDGLQDRSAYDRKATQWAWNFVNELEEKSSQFREDYRDNKDDGEWTEEINGGEEED